MRWIWKATFITRHNVELVEWMAGEANTRTEALKMASDATNERRVCLDAKAGYIENLEGYNED